MNRHVSVVILTRNRAAQCLASVERALALPERPPVVVVDNGSTDGTPLALKARFPQAKLVRVPFDMGPAARNLGVQCAETRYVAFADDDCAWGAGALKAGCDLMDFYPRLAALSARVLGGDGREEPACSLMARSALPGDGVPGRALLGFLPYAALFRRAAFQELDGYEPRLGAGAQETLLAYDLAAAGWKMAYAPQLLVHRHAPRMGEPDSGRARARDALWVAWMRRPLGRALSATGALVGENPLALLEALRGLGWALRERRVLPESVEHLCELAEAQNAVRQRFA